MYTSILVYQQKPTQAKAPNHHQAHKKTNTNWNGEKWAKFIDFIVPSNSFIMEFFCPAHAFMHIYKIWSVFNRNLWKINKQMFSCFPFHLLNSRAIKITNFKLTFLPFLPDSCSHVNVCVLVFVEWLLCPFLVCTMSFFFIFSFIWFFFFSIEYLFFFC